MALSLHYIGDEILKRRSRPVETFGEALRGRVDEMIELMLQEGGMGLAGPQAGLDAHFFIFISNAEDDERDENEIVFMANMEILESSKKETDFEEGCLSVPGLREDVKRPEWLRVSFQDIEGQRCELETGGLMARVIQHEFDHCEGVLFIDRLSTIRRTMLRKEIEAIQTKYSDRRG